MVSNATVVFPVPFSPWMSSDWPRPRGVMASIALMPVVNGWSMGKRSEMWGCHELLLVR